MIEHEQPEGRRKIAVLALSIDAGYQIGQRRAAALGDFLQALPKGVLKADARLVPREDNGPLNDWRFHDPPHLNCAANGD